MTATRHKRGIPTEGAPLAVPLVDTLSFGDEHTHEGTHSLLTPRGWYRLASDVVERCTQFVDSTTEALHEIAHGNYSPKFKREFRDRLCFESDDGVQLTARVFNPEFLDNEQHAIVYSFSLGVPASHGVEIPTLADIVAHGEETGRAVIAITTDGLAGPTNPLKLVDFWRMVHRRFEVLRQLLPDGKKIIVTGSSLGGMLSHGLAASWQEEAKTSGHMVRVTNDIAVASAGHHRYTLTELPKIGAQFMLREPPAVARYVKSGETPKDMAQRVFELFGTIPRHPTQYASIAIVGISILLSPLEDKEHHIPHETTITDHTFGHDTVTHPHRRTELWGGTNHPDVSHTMHEAHHTDGLLIIGREETLKALKAIPLVDATF